MNPSAAVALHGPTRPSAFRDDSDNPGPRKGWWPILHAAISQS